MKKTVLALVVVLAMSLGGCSESDSDVVTIRSWHSFVSTTRPALDELIHRFEAEHPGIRINAQYVPTGDGLVHKLVSAVQSGTAPDVSWMHADFRRSNQSARPRADAIHTR